MAEAGKAKKRARSPNYPFVDLQVAVGHTEALYSHDRRHPVPILIAHERWGYKRGSAAGNQCTAALKSYGLIRVEGRGDDRKLSVTEAGERIVRHAPDRPQRLRDAALSPPIHSELWSKYREAGLPSDDVVKNYLVWEREQNRFNEDVVDGVICRFRDTIAFANVQNTDTIEEDEGLSYGEEKQGNGILEVLGPLVPSVKKQAVVEGMIKQDIFALDEGQIVIQWPTILSEASFDDVKDWLKILQRKIGRCVRPRSASEPMPEVDSGDDDNA